MSSLTTSKAWTALQNHYHQTKNNSLRDAFKRRSLIGSISSQFILTTFCLITPKTE